MIDDFKGVQHEILTSKNSNILVSAGAGSGKTTIMIEKIADLIINKNVPVNKLLVVTFTVLAAQEIKDRLSEKLNTLIETAEDKQKILNLLEQVKTASIDTIDGFSSKTIKKYFYNLQISPNIELISEASKDYYLTKALKQTFDNFDPDKLLFLLDIFGGDRRNLNSLSELVLKTYFNIINLEDYNLFLQQATEQYKDNSGCEKIVKDYFFCKIKKANKIAKEGYVELEPSLQSACKNWIGELDSLEKQNSLEEVLTLLLKLPVPELRAKKGCEQFKQSVNIIKEFVAKLKFEGIDNTFKQKNEEILPILGSFLQLLQNFLQNYSQIKQKNNLIDFNDLNRLMLDLLSINQVREELQNQYEYIFIDEYQDVNPLQDNLINKLVSANTKLFLVGDVKQSIYGFRGANPSSFLDRYVNYNKNKAEGIAYNMNDNYRSNPQILNFVNQVFSRVMTEGEADINYKKDATIIPKRDDIADEKVNILLALKPEQKIASGVYSVKEDLNSATQDSEAVLVLLAITNLIGKPFYDAKQKTTRTLDYSDIAILSRSTEDADGRHLVEFLREHNVPIKTNTKLDTNQNEGVKLVLSILKAVVKTADDVDYLASIMALTRVSLEEIANIKENNKSFYDALNNTDNKFVLEFKNIIKQIYFASLHCSVSGLINKILDDFRVRYYLLLKPNGAQIVKEIEEFALSITSLENTLNLAEFIKIVESSINKAGEVESLDDEKNVTFLTIHKSKGLEFPVVILFNSAKQFNYITENPLINFNSSIGLGIDYYNFASRTKTNSLPKFAIKLTNDSKSYKEEMRLLYVALTRAKNKLIITGEYSKSTFETDVKNTSFLNMLVSGFLPLKEGENIFKHCNIFLLDQIETTTNSNLYENRKVVFDCKDFSYNNKEKFLIPLKNTVTGLNSKKSEQTGFVTKQWLNSSAQAEVEEDKALIGTHYHNALENLDFSKPYTKQTNFEDVDYKLIEQAHKVLSPLTANAKQHKEAEFMMYVPYNKLVQSNIENKVLVQGVVDLILEYEKSVVIVDYKFSALPIKVLKQRYSQQLELYKMAVENAFKKPVEHMYIYSINSGELG